MKHVHSGKFVQLTDEQRRIGLAIPDIEDRKRYLKDLYDAAQPFDIKVNDPSRPA